MNSLLQPPRNLHSLAVVFAALLAPPGVAAQVTIGSWWERHDAFERPPFEETWLDRTQQGFHNFLARTARTIDSWGGPPLEKQVYEGASGSVALAVLWDEFHGLDLKARFRVDLPLPQINRRLRLFVGRLNRDEFVTERDAPSGAFPDLPTGLGDDEDQTLAGLAYYRPGRDGGDFSASVGGRVRSSEFDPYIKAAYLYRWTPWGDTLLTAKETIFYQMSEQFGSTTRVTFERAFGEAWWMRWVGSATFSEGTDGVRGFSTLTLIRALPARRAIALQLAAEGDTSADVSLEEFGVKVAYRRAILRDWLVLELRTSLMWPQEYRDEPRKPSWGFGVGCEMYFGGEQFSILPVTF